MTRRRTARQLLDASVTEEDWARTVYRQARLFGWACYHTHDSRKSEPGWPDWALVRPPRLILAELKTETGTLTAAQRKWAALLEACNGVEFYLWRPSDFEEVIRILLPAGSRIHDDETFPLRAPRATRQDQPAPRSLSGPTTLDR